MASAMQAYKQGKCPRSTAAQPVVPQMPISVEWSYLNTLSDFVYVITTLSKYATQLLAYLHHKKNLQLSTFFNSWPSKAGE